MKKFFKKFKFRWFSWEIDSVKLFPFLILFLAFLPILPYEKKDGKLVSVLGLQANVNNFYDLGIKSIEEGGTKEGDALFFGPYIQRCFALSEARVAQKQESAKAVFPHPCRHN